MAKCLRDILDVSAAFATFERVRRDRVDAVVRQSQRTGRQKMQAGWIGPTIRDLVLPVFLRRAAAGAQALYRYPAVWPEGIQCLKRTIWAVSER